MSNISLLMSNCALNLPQATNIGHTTRQNRQSLEIQAAHLCECWVSEYKNPHNLIT